MTEIVLLRHAQASFGGSNYDQLSDTGYEQARRLGDYFREQGEHFDRCVIGTLLRHRQTLETAQVVSTESPLEQLAGLNEIEHWEIVKAYLDACDPGRQVDFSDTASFLRLLSEALAAWADDRVPGKLPESWGQFQIRIRETLRVLVDNPDSTARIFVVSSAGTISALLREVLDISAGGMIDLMEQIHNTSISRLQVSDGHVRLESFNLLPHLENPSMKHLVTII